MIPKAKKRLKRILLPLLFCIAASLILGTLNALNEAKLRKYEEELQSIPVTLTMTTPTGRYTKMKVLSSGRTVEEKITPLIDEWVLQLFKEYTPVFFYDVSEAKDSNEARELKNKVVPSNLCLAEYVKDVKYTISMEIDKVSDYSFGRTDHYEMYGIPSLSCDPYLSSEECEITWYEGYDESVFEGENAVCLIPSGKAQLYDNGNGKAVVLRTVTFTRYETVDGKREKVETSSYERERTLKIVGTYTGGDFNSVYCPMPIVEQMSEELEIGYTINALSATLADNSRLEEFREKASFCFLEPSPENEDVPWGYYVGSQSSFSHHDVYPLGLAIDDEALLALPDVTEECARFAKIVKIGITIFSVIAGILAGYLIIRDNKSGILQKREAGRSNTVLCIGFMLEQLLCTIVGVAIGGAFFMWKPTEDYLIFAAVYFVALSIALAIFMSKRIIETITGDEE
ncbi:MAG: hypothetical protein IKK74_09380 [Clostridia bacterium]|nr:hypothetical protein [Clostridia bacterium]